MRKTGGSGAALFVDVNNLPLREPDDFTRFAEHAQVSWGRLYADWTDPSLQALAEAAEALGLRLEQAREGADLQLAMDVLEAALKPSPPTEIFAACSPEVFRTLKSRLAQHGVVLSSYCVAATALGSNPEGAGDDLLIRALQSLKDENNHPASLRSLQDRVRELDPEFGLPAGFIRFADWVHSEAEKGVVWVESREGHTSVSLAAPAPPSAAKPQSGPVVLDLDEDPVDVVGLPLGSAGELAAGLEDEAFAGSLDWELPVAPWPDAARSGLYSISAS